MSAAKPRHCPISTLLPVFAALPSIRRAGASRGQDGGAAGFLALPAQKPSFVFVPAAPDPEFLVGGQGVYQAGLPHWAAGADRLGLLDSLACRFRPWPYCGVRVISTVFPPKLMPEMSKLDSAPIWPLYPWPVNQIPVPVKEFPIAEELLVIV